MQLIDFSERRASYVLTTKVDGKLFVFALKGKNDILIPLFYNQEKAEEFSRELEKSVEYQVRFNIFNIPETLLPTFLNYLIFYNAMSDSVKILTVEDSDIFLYNEENSKNFVLIEVDA